MKNTLKVVFLHRKKQPTQFSIEKIFSEIRKYLPSDIKPIIHVSPYASQGLLYRLKNLRAASKLKADIFHITGDIHYIALALKSNKTILTIHDIGFMNHPSKLARWILKYFWLIFPVKKVKWVTVISQATKDHILQYVKVPPEKIKVIPDFISKDYAPILREFNVSKPEILQIGTKSNKNLERVIPALAGIDCRLTIIGKLSESQLALLKKHQIQYRNLVGISDQELINVYQESDLLVFCSTLEGFGLPIIEAQSIGRPVITGNISSMPEVAGMGAHLVDPYDISAIHQGIQKIINEKSYRDQLIKYGFENIKRFDPQKIAFQYYQIYQQLHKNTKSI